ncbi:MAG: hypothetical protein IJG55_10610 [Synergistaceae bacterium]|nr:hypothetical protein [Synergistaceae bacterium]
MSTAVLEKESRLSTGNEIIDTRLPLLTEKELARVADYIRYVIWSRIDDDENDDDDDGSWADAPLTHEEEAQIAESRRDFENGEYLTLDELVEGL